MVTPDKPTSRPNKPEQFILDELVRRTTAVARPLRIILFGSAARETMGPDSDLDVLVVVPDGCHRRHTAQAIYMNLRGIGLPKDIVVATESDVEQYQQNPSLVLFPALREGREIYRAGE